MDQAIISRATIEAKARRDFAQGRGRDEHGFNWHAPALPTWHAEWDRCKAAQTARAAQAGPTLEVAEP